MSPLSPRPPLPESRAALANAVWDLRDLAYDNPEPWARITAQAFFQSFAEVLEDMDDNPGNLTHATWTELIRTLRSAAEHAATHASEPL